MHERDKKRTKAVAEARGAKYLRVRCERGDEHAEPDGGKAGEEEDPEEYEEAARERVQPHHPIYGRAEEQRAQKIYG